MSDPVRFLQALANALSTMALYPEGHPARERAVSVPFEELVALTRTDGTPTFTLLDNDVVYGRDALRELRGWGWARRLSAAGVQRLEFVRALSRAEFDGLLQELSLRLSPAGADTADNRQMRDLGVRFGAVGVEGMGEGGDGADGARGGPGGPQPGQVTPTIAEEAETLRWLHDEVRTGAGVPLVEAEAVIRSLGVAMHSGRGLILPLLQLRDFDEYTTTHSLNVAVLAMGLAEWLGCSPREVRSYGVSGLLHDIGKVKIPLEVLTKPGALTAEERTVMNRHPEDGARILLATESHLEAQGVVAYEHHIMLNGGGYPALRYARPCSLASRLVHVCDVYDALRTRRPYRDAWASDRVEAYLEERAGSEFDPDLVSAFLQMLRTGHVEARVLSDDDLVEKPPARQDPC